MPPKNKSMLMHPLVSKIGSKHCSLMVGKYVNPDDNPSPRYFGHCPRIISKESDTRCNNATFAVTKTKYGNAVTHLRSCYGEYDNLDEVVKAFRKANGGKIKKILPGILGMKLTPFERS